MSCTGWVTPLKYVHDERRVVREPANLIFDLGADAVEVRGVARVPMYGGVCVKR